MIFPQRIYMVINLVMVMLCLPGNAFAVDFVPTQKNYVITGAIVALALLIALLSRLQNKRLKSKLLKENEIEKKTFKKYRIMLENSDEGVIIVQNLKVKYVNKQGLKIMGLSHDAEVSRNIGDYIHIDDLDVVLECYERVVLSRATDDYIMVRLTKPDQSFFWANLKATYVDLSDDPFILVFLRDVTRQKLLEDDLQHAQRMEAIGALSGGIAHDFNNILTTIIGNAEIALMDIPENEAGRAEFEEIRKSGYRARDLVRQILTISREHSMDIQPMSLVPVIKEAVKLLKSTFPSNYQIFENIDCNLKLVKADPTQLYQVFMNLCTNSKDAMENNENPCLEVGLENVCIPIGDKRVSNNLKPGEYVRLSVTDNGGGIPPDIQEKIFEPYFTTKGKVKGTGLGLATAMGIVKQSDGYMLCNSEPQIGSCFSVYLPVFEKNRQEQPYSEQIIEENKNGCIIFVDDEEQIGVIAKKMFEHIGFSMVITTSGTDAFEQFSMSPDSFDLMITDLDMPGMSGEQLTREVLKIRPDFPVIICSGHSDTLDEQKAKAAGAVEYILKPYNLKKLSLAAAKYIKRVQAA